VRVNYTCRAAGTDRGRGRRVGGRVAVAGRVRECVRLSVLRRDPYYARSRPYRRTLLSNVGGVALNTGVNLKQHYA